MTELLAYSKNVKKIKSIKHMNEKMSYNDKDFWS